MRPAASSPSPENPDSPEAPAATGAGRRHGRRRAASALAVAVLLAGGPAGAVAAPQTAVPQSDVVAVAQVPPGLESFYAQVLTWAPCGLGAECATLQVPMDYANPAGAQVQLAVKRVRSADAAARTGSLLVNFGGPGGSGTQSLEAWAAGLDPRIRAAYDLVGFDPRGVASSTAVECLDDAGMDAKRATQFDPDTEEGLAALTAYAQEYAAACARSTGPLLAEVDTVSAAQDLDVLRAVLGEEDLDYVGYSYGTQLGSTYADLFPEHTGRLVLDGAMDPTLDYAEVTLGQAYAFERSFRVYVESCLPMDGCPFEGTPEEASAEVAALLERLGTTPLPTADGRPLTADDALTGMLLPLYNERLWPWLTQALKPALDQGDGTALMFLADARYGRAADGTYRSNGSEANTAINCLDLPVDTDPEAMAALDAQLQEASPTFGDLFSHGEVFCGEWPHGPAPERPARPAAGAAPILVIGTTGDPATPYVWAEALAEQLESGHLLTYQGEGHTAYTRGNACVDATVNTYLLEGTLPAEEKTC